MSEKNCMRTSKNTSALTFQTWPFLYSQKLVRISSNNLSEKNSTQTWPGRPFTTNEIVLCVTLWRIWRTGIIWRHIRDIQMHWTISCMCVQRKTGNRRAEQTREEPNATFRAEDCCMGWGPGKQVFKAQTGDWWCFCVNDFEYESLQGTFEALSIHRMIDSQRVLSSVWVVCNVDSLKTNAKREACYRKVRNGRYSNSFFEDDR